MPNCVVLDHDGEQLSAVGAGGVAHHRECMLLALNIHRVFKGGPKPTKTFRFCTRVHWVHEVLGEDWKRKDNVPNNADIVG